MPSLGAHAADAVSGLGYLEGSWPNQVERFFALITDKAIRRGSLISDKQLVQRIDQFDTHNNAKSKPFRWTATADSIQQKLHRLGSRISETPS